jgi:hypothetical protein
MKKSAPPVVYEFYRLGFRRDKIEKLDPAQRFRVISPAGTFEMTREEFEHVFANVVRSRSYLINGLYHYPVVPQKAEPFRLK